MNPFKFCPVCGDVKLHKGPMCMDCGTVEAATHQPAYRTEQEILQRRSDKKRFPPPARLQ